MIERVPYRLRRAYRELREPPEQLSEREVRALQAPHSGNVAVSVECEESIRKAADFLFALHTIDEACAAHRLDTGLGQSRN